MAEAESVLAGRPKMASPESASRDESFHCSSLPEEEKKPQLPTCPPSTSPVPTLPETLHITNGSNSSPAMTPTKPGTLRKSSGKKKRTKSSKDACSQNSKMTLHNSPDQSSGASGECPYSDLESVPKILCPKALERQSNAVPSQLSVAVVKEQKKQPEIQSGLWFSKAGKDRRPKTTSPIPDRSLFSKVPSKKKNPSTATKKIPVPCASYSGGSSDPAALSDKNKPADNNLLAEQCGTLQCKDNQVDNKSLDSSVSFADQVVLLDKLETPVSVESVCSKGRKTGCNSADATTDLSSSQPQSSDVRKHLEPSKKVNVTSESSFSKSVKNTSQVIATKQVNITDKVSDKADSIKTPAPHSPSEPSDTLSRLERQTILVSKCRLPFVKLIRKEIKDRRYLNSSVTVCPTDQTGYNKKEKSPDTDDTKTCSHKSDRIDIKTSASIGHRVTFASVKVSVKKLKAGDGSGLLQLPSESSNGHNTVASDSCDDNSGFMEEEPVPVSRELNPTEVTHSPSKRTDESERKQSPAPEVTAESPEHSESVEQNVSAVTSTTTALPSCEVSESHDDSVRQSSHVPGKVQKAVFKSKQVSVLNKVIEEQPAHLPASNRLMTRALKAMREADQKKHEKAQKHTEKKRLSNPFRRAEDLVRKPEAKVGLCMKIKSVKSHGVDSGLCNPDKSSRSRSPSFIVSDSNDFETDVKSEDEDLSISSTPPMDFIPLTSSVKAKNEGQSSDIHSSSSPSSPFSFMNDFKNVEEVSFQSLTHDSDGKPISFKPDTNYKFSTFLMMLKDLHDTRERDGAPLELEIGPPSAHVKEEPLVVPREASSAGQDPQIQHVLGNSSTSPDKALVTQNERGTSQTPKRPYNRRGSSVGFKRKPNRRVPCRPARSGPGFPGLESSPRTGSSSVSDSLSKVEFSSRALVVQSSSWEKQAGGDEGLVFSEEQKRLNRHIMVPLEKREGEAPLCLGQENVLVSDCTKDGISLMESSAGGDKAPEGKGSVIKKSSDAQCNSQIYTMIHKELI